MVRPNSVGQHQENNTSLEKFKLFFNSTIGEDDEVKAFLATNGGGLLTSTTAGGKEALDVNIAASDISINVAESDVYAEDSAHSSGDEGAFMLAVRRDARAVGSDADGDYSSLNVNASGELWVKDADVLAQLQSGVTISDGGGSITVDGTVAATQSGTWSNQITDGVDTLAVNADGSINTQATLANVEFIGGNLSVADSVLLNSLAQPAVTTTEVAVSAVSNQKKLTIQNLSNEDIYYGPTGVTTSSGLLLPKKSSLEIDAAGDLYLIAGAALPANSVRVAHWSAT